MAMFFLDQVFHPVRFLQNEYRRVEGNQTLSTEIAKKHKYTKKKLVKY